MHIAVYVPLVISLVGGLRARWLAVVLPPRAASVVLTAGAVLLALGSSLCVALLALVGVLDLRSWSLPVGPVPRPVAVSATAVLVVAAARLARVLVRHGRDVVAARRLTAHLGGSPGGVVLVDSRAQLSLGRASPVFAVAARGGRVVASRQVLHALAPREQRALLAHEASHLRHRHDRYRLLARLAGALDPLLSGVPRAVEYATERWADEDAGREVGSRKAAARALAGATLQAAGVRPRPVRPEASVMGGDGSDVVARVRALLAPAPPLRPLQVMIVAALTTTSVVAAVHAQLDAAELLCSALARAL